MCFRRLPSRIKRMNYFIHSLLRCSDDTMYNSLAHPRSISKFMIQNGFHYDRPNSIRFDEHRCSQQGQHEKSETRLLLTLYSYKTVPCSPTRPTLRMKRLRQERLSPFPVSDITIPTSHQLTSLRALFRNHSRLCERLHARRLPACYQCRFFSPAQVLRTNHGHRSWSFPSILV